MNRLLVLAFVLLGALLPGAAGAEVRLSALRHGSQEGATRIVLELTGKPAWKTLSLDDPPRIALDVVAVPDPGIEAVAIGDGRVERIRVGRPDGATTRIVFDLGTIIDYRVFDLEPGDGQPHRLVVDFFGGPARGGAPKSRASEPGGGGAPAEPAVVRAVPREPPARSGPITVVIDAGHGGQDPGARGHGNDEKDICLAMARKLAAEIDRRPGYRARLTRDADIFIPLRKRIEIAESMGGDAFISVHCNAAKSAKAKGTEVYFLSLSGATDEASKELARLENAADLMGGVAPEADDDLSSILFDMQQTDVLHRASLLAESVVEALRPHPQLSTRGVKQAGFVVLKSPKIPSILVEAAFITNSAESRLLKSAEFQTGFVRRVADGVVRYFESTALAGLRR
jgi:N-acetylmuramoyl-L-alanine amidase